MCTSMNYQPFRIVVVRGNDREKFRESLLGSNARATTNAAAYVTFITDASIFIIIIDPSQSCDMFADMMHRSTVPEGSINFTNGYGILIYI